MLRIYLPSISCCRAEEQPSRSSSRTVFVTVNVPASPTFLTTTVTTGGAPGLPTVGAVIQSRGSDVPVAVIASGTAVGVVLALVAVIGWTWWGRCIKRRAAKERKEAVRENTRKNASGLSYPASQYRPAFSIRDSHGRKVTFASHGPASSQSTPRYCRTQAESLRGRKIHFTGPYPSTPNAFFAAQEHAEEAGTWAASAHFS
ncbi:hypothetical protein C8Q76DRAFT_796786 [Earliella scabrosa]|nr:hypothetical protein C8Q76DRAFT_796786 [Earliella scabrosa]